jgi:DNA-binding NarL/FixJ family response regulator
MIYKLILADDHPFLLSGIKAALQDFPHLHVVATANNGHELITQVIAHQPHMVVMDLNMPGMDGFQCLKKIKAQHDSVKVLVLTNYSQPELMQEVQALKADGFMVKNTDVHELITGIETILGGKLWFHFTNKSVMDEDGYFMDEFLKKFQLTKREVTIISLICQEKSSKKIAAELNLSELTINTHRRNIFRKLDVSNVAGLVNFARQYQLL